MNLYQKLLKLFPIVPLSLKITLTLFLLLQVSVSASDVNLLTNPGAESDYTGWTISNGGSGWSTTFSGPNSGSKCWSSSYDPCSITQTIDLIEKGFTKADLDLSPQISAGAFVTTNYWSSGYVTVRTQLLDSIGNVLYTSYAVNNQLLEHKNWVLKYTSIAGYPAGVRKIRFTMTGEGTLYWAGQYGPSFDDAFVYILTKTKAISDNITDIRPRGAILNGVVYPNNQSTVVRFEYGKSPLFGSQVLADQSPVSGTAPVAVNKTMVLSPNTTYYSRIVAINATDTSYGETRTFKTPDVILTGSVMSLPIGDTVGATASLNINSTIYWQSSDNASWLTVSPSSDRGNATLSLQVSEANPGFEPRAATITLWGDSVNLLIAVTQQGGSINIFPSNMNVDSDADSFSIKVRTVFKWAAAVDVPWINLSSDSVNGSSVLKFSVTENADRENRTGNITVSNNHLSKTFTIVQSKGIFNIQPASMFSGADADTLEFAVETNFTWAAKTDASWLSVTSDSIHGDSVITFIVDENTTGQERTGIITISNSRITGSFTIIQGILKGAGTADNPYLISDYTGLKYVKRNLNSHYRLLKDIDASASISENSGLGFEPIGNATSRFKGGFDGEGFVISNLNIYANNYVGLFGYSDNATIKNIGLINCKIDGSFYTGALCGYSISSVIDNCFMSGIVNGRNNSTGGLIGYGSSMQITRSFTTGTVKGKAYTGGLIGNAQSGTISNCYSTADVTGTDRCGGLAGYSIMATYINNYTAARITANTNYGGFNGYDMASTFTRNFYNSDITRLYTTNKGTPSTTIHMKLLSNYTLWNFTDIWAIQNDSTYPGLKSLNNAPFAYLDTLEISGYTSLNKVLANDFDLESIQDSLVFKPTHVYGSGEVLNGEFFRFPEGTLNGTMDSITYRVGEILSSGDTLWGNQAMAVLIKTANNPPVGMNDTLTMFSGDTLVFTDSILENDLDTENNALIIKNILASDSTRGEIITVNGSFKYIPLPEWNGMDSMLYVMSDGEFNDTAFIAVKVITISELSWSNPSDIIYGTPLGMDQLNASSEVPGSFIYNPEPGTIMNSGQAQELKVLFIPTDTIYNTKAQKTVYINVNKGMSQVFLNPRDTSIIYGTALDFSVFVDSTNVPGSFELLPAVGSIPEAGENQPVEVTFIPNDTLNYNILIENVLLDVDKAVLYITAENQSILRGNAIPELTLSYTGFVNNDAISDLDELPVASTLATSMDQPGEYDIVVTGGSDNNYEYALVNGILEIAVNTGLNEVSTSVSIYPNPVTDYLMISADAKEIAYSVISMTGTIMDKGVAGDDKMIAVSHLQPGNYILKLTINGKTINYTLIKQ